MEKYKVGDWVVCNGLTEGNPEGMRLNGYYEVVGATLIEGDLLYTLKDCYGGITFSMDNFRKYTVDDFFNDEM